MTPGTSEREGRRPSSRQIWIFVVPAIVVLYFFSYLFARGFFGLRFTASGVGTPSLDNGGITFRSFVPDAVLDGMNLFYLPMRRADESWTGTGVRFERIRTTLPSGSTLEL